MNFIQKVGMVRSWEENRCLKTDDSIRKEKEFNEAKPFIKKSGKQRLPTPRTCDQEESCDHMELYLRFLKILILPVHF